MSLYYSPSILGFLDDSIHNTLPEDAIEITQAQYDELLLGLYEGQPITIEGGQPVLGVIPEKVVTWEQIRASRDSLLSQCDWTQLPDVTMASGTLQAWRDYRQALRDITATFSDANDVTWPEMPA